MKMADGGWNPYFAGALLGALAIASVYANVSLTGRARFLGASTTFVRAAGYMEQAAVPDRVASNEYFQKTKPQIDWQFMLLIGVFAGAMISSLMDKSFKLEKVPPIWRERFGASVWKRGVWAFLGGIVAMIGARMADGCPSGHGLSGLMQLSVSAFVALALFFGVGLVVAALVYGRRSA